MRLASLFILLLVFWFLLSGETKPFLVAIGIASAAGVTYLAGRMKIVDDEGLPLRFSSGAVTYWPWLVLEIYKSAWQASRIILDPRLPISPNMLRIEPSQKTPVGITTYANSITLTPGTISAYVSGTDREIIVHALTDATADGVREGTMDRRVVAFEGRA